MKPMVTAERTVRRPGDRACRVHDRRNGKAADQVHDERAEGERAAKALRSPEGNRGARIWYTSRTSQTNPKKPFHVAWVVSRRPYTVSTQF